MVEASSTFLPSAGATSGPTTADDDSSKGAVKDEAEGAAIGVVFCDRFFEPIGIVVFGAGVTFGAAMFSAGVVFGVLAPGAVFEAAIDAAFEAAFDAAFGAAFAVVFSVVEGDFRTAFFFFEMTVVKALSTRSCVAGDGIRER